MQTFQVVHVFNLKLHSDCCIINKTFNVFTKGSAVWQGRAHCYDGYLSY